MCDMRPTVCIVHVDNDHDRADISVAQVAQVQIDQSTAVYTDNNTDIMCDIKYTCIYINRK
jgi:hypothetical protein